MSKKRKQKKATGPHKAVGKTGPGQFPESPISLSMIVKNEEKFLEECLKSVQGLVGEIIIVDTGSADKTIEIAKKYNAKIFHFDWINDFAAARNFALKHSTLPWVLYLDADERLEAQFHDLVLRHVQKDVAEAFYLKVYSVVSGVLGNVPHVQAYPRLFKKLPGASFEGRIHEQITPSLKRLNARFHYLDVTVNHLGYAQDDEVLKNKIRRNLELLYDQIEKEPDNAYAHFQLGQTLILDDQFEAGREALLKCLAFKQLPANLTSTTLLMLGNEYFKLEDYDNTLKYLDEGLALAPRQRLGYFLKSETLAKKQEWHAAIQCLEKVVEYSDVPFSDISIEKTFDEHLISQRLGLYHFNVKDYRKSMTAFLAYFEQTGEIRSSFIDKWAFAWKNDGQDLNGATDALKLFKTHLVKCDEPAASAKILAGVAEVAGQPGWMEYYLRESIKHHPEDGAIQFYLGNLELNRGNLPLAEKHFADAVQLEPYVWESTFNWAVANIKMLRFDAAIKILESALLDFPQQEEKIKRLLIGLYAKNGVSLSHRKSDVVSAGK